MLERRRSQRQRCFLRGSIEFVDRLGKIACVVRDLSADGARVSFPSQATPPDVVKLHIPHRQKTTLAQVRWRRGEDLGVSFPNEMTDLLSERGYQLLRRIAQLEVEVADLKRKVKKLKCENYGPERPKD
jgi:hypothetical protein